MIKISIFGDDYGGYGWIGEFPLGNMIGSPYPRKISLGEMLSNIRARLHDVGCTPTACVEVSWPSTGSPNRQCVEIVRVSQIEVGMFK